MNLGKSLLIIAALATTAFASAQTHLTKAQSLVNTLRTQGNNGTFTDTNGKELNQYGASYKDIVMVWTPTAKVNAVCGNFITKLLENSYTWTAKGAGFDTVSPNAEQYHDAIEGNLYGFTHITNFDNILAGDLLVAKYLDGSTDSGHAMLVENAAVLDEDLDTKEKVWSVTVIDCSKKTHANDSRVFTLANGSTKVTQGAGRGTMRVYTKNGAIQGYTWSMTGSMITPDVRHLTLGRLDIAD